MQLPPQLGEKRRHKAVKYLELVDQGVVRGAKRDQQPVARDAWPAVMHMDLYWAVVQKAADPAGAPVALDNLAAAAIKVEPVMPLGGVAGCAQASGQDGGRSTRTAAEGELPGADAWRTDWEQSGHLRA